MLQHQFTETLTLARFGSIRQLLVGEIFETAANLAASAGIYYVLVLARWKQTLSEQLRESEKRYRTVTEESPVPIVVATDDTVTFANQAAAELIGVEDPELLYELSLSEFIHPADRETFQENLQQTESKTKDVVGEYRLNTRGKSERTAIVSGSRAPYDGDEGVYLVFRDVTEERELEKGIERVEDRFETTLENSNDAVFVIDAEEEQIKSVNRTTVELLDYKRKELEGMPVREIHPHEMDTFESFVDDVITDGGNRTNELSCMTKRGTEVPVEISASRVGSPDDSIILAAARDISERKRRTKQIGVLRRILRHNLRNEMSIIKGFAEAITKRTDDEFVRDAAERIISSGEELLESSEKQRLLEELIDKTDTNRDPANVVPSLEQTCRTLRETYPSAKIEVELPATAYTIGPEAVSWAVKQLLKNGIEHNDSEDIWVRLCVEKKQRTDSSDRLKIIIEDNGPGIPEYELAAIDHNIQQTSIRHGSGFGLHVVNQVVDTVGGDIQFETDSSGTVVSISLPTERAE
jgi:PAS domain S-box-containing protein